MRWFGVILALVAVVLPGAAGGGASGRSCIFA